MDKVKILMHGQDCIPDKEFEEIRDLVKGYYHFSNVNFWMWKMFQFGFAYGKLVERARRKVVIGK